MGGRGRGGTFGGTGLEIFHSTPGIAVDVPLEGHDLVWGPAQAGRVIFLTTK